MMDNIFCIIAKNEDEFKDSTIQLLSKYGIVEKHVMPKDTTYPKFVNNLVLQNNISHLAGFLHIIDSGVKLLKDPEQFLEELEDMMAKLKQHVWLSTVCDECNFVYKKYNPRIRVSFDDDKSKGLLKTKSIVFTSNANTAWIAYDLSSNPNKLLKFDERFEIPMFYIIELLARRRNTKDKGQLYYMNQYLSVESELGTFVLEKSVNSIDKTEDEVEQQKKMAKENELFQQMAIDIKPDNSVDVILEDLYNTLKPNKTASSEEKTEEKQK